MRFRLWTGACKAGGKGVSMGERWLPGEVGNKGTRVAK